MMNTLEFTFLFISFTFDAPGENVFIYRYPTAVYATVDTGKQSAYLLKSRLVGTRIIFKYPSLGLVFVYLLFSFGS